MLQCFRSTKKKNNLIPYISICYGNCEKSRYISNCVRVLNHKSTLTSVQKILESRYRYVPVSHYLTHYKSKTFNGEFELLNRSKYFQIMLRSLCSSEIPEYLKQIANKVPEIEEDILEGLEETENSMEDEVIDFLLSRAISYEELDGSFIVGCPSCGNSNKTHDLFVDKNSGYCVCPWCCWDGNWRDLIKLFDAKVDSLTKSQLENYFLTLKPLDKCHESILKISVLKNISIKLLKSIGTHITEDYSHVVFPLKCEDDERIGFVNMSLLHPVPKFAQRVLEGRDAVFTGLPKQNNKMQRAVVVSNVLDALCLAEYRFNAFVLISDPKFKTLDWALKNFKSVILWMDPSFTSENLLSYLSMNGIKSFGVHTKHGPISPLNKTKLKELLENAEPVLPGGCVTAHDLKDKAFERIRSKEEMFGTKWTRFTELNNLLLGHREGELTIFSGPTGSGKTTFMSEYSLDLCMQGVQTLWGSFEISALRLFEIMLHQFSGKAPPHDYYKFEELVQQFETLPLHFFNKHGQQPLKDIIGIMAEKVLFKGVRHVIIDNLQFMLGQHGASGDWWLEQDRAVGAFRKFATEYNCHVALIVHPRKLHMGQKLNMHTISGGARVTQEADNVMILHVKQNSDGSSNYSAPKTLQLVKNRYGGTLGEMRLTFHKESKTLSSCFRKKKDELNTGSDQSTVNERNHPADVRGIPSLQLFR